MPKGIRLLLHVASQPAPALDTALPLTADRIVIGGGILGVSAVNKDPGLLCTFRQAGALTLKISPKDVVLPRDAAAIASD